MYKQFDMEYIKKLSDLSDKLMKNYYDDCINESQTKQSFILPFFEILGYPIYDINICQLEVPIADEESNTCKHLDYLLTTEYKVEIIVEAKPLKCKNLDKGTIQLQDYLKISDCKLGIITNGDKYEVYYKNYSEVKLIARFSLKNLHIRDLYFLTCISYDCRLFVDRYISPFDIIRQQCLDVTPLDFYFLMIVYNPLLCYQASLDVSIQDLTNLGVSKDGLFSMLNKGFLDVINNVVYINYSHRIFESLSDIEFYNLFGFYRVEFPDNKINSIYSYHIHENDECQYIFTEKNLENIYFKAKESRKQTSYNGKFLREFIDANTFKVCCNIHFFMKDSESKGRFFVDLETYNFSDSLEFKNFYCSLKEDIENVTREEIEEDILFDDSIFAKYLDNMKDDFFDNFFSERR